LSSARPKTTSSLMHFPPEATRRSWPSSVMANNPKIASMSTEGAANELRDRLKAGWMSEDARNHVWRRRNSGCCELSTVPTLLLLALSALLD
jgi:hypothetical protein